MLVRDSRQRDNGDSASYDALRVSRAVKISRSIAMETVFNDESAEGSGNRCVTQVRSKINGLASNILDAIAKSSCVRAVATQIAIQSGHKMGFELSKGVVKIGKHRKRYPSGNLGTRLRFGPLYVVCVCVCSSRILIVSLADLLLFKNISRITNTSNTDTVRRITMMCWNGSS